MVRVRCWGREVREGDQLRVGGDQISSVWTRSPNRGAVVADIPAVAREGGGKGLAPREAGEAEDLARYAGRPQNCAGCGDRGGG